ncbi:unnamed protein product [Angiostrongylus costaricensis]|uniref:1-alkyl-2-acetylglycerophosphocholine esterase n=1 Tax=Angiostrongylus costaricensis TaxID=334426 RepID=A0A0R3PMI0_ANGCS|nr:unnamed protein product [Angiostrongylus costaricensis]
MGALWSVTSRASILPLVGSGPYAAGCADLMITDSNDGDTGVFMRIYYPTDKDRVSNRTKESDHPLWIDRPEYVIGLASYLKQSAGRLQYILNWIIGETRLACVGRAKLALKDAFPVIVFSHGLAGSRQFYSTFCSSLASYGFVAAAIEHSDYSACWTFKLVPDPASGRLVERHFAIRLFDHTDKRTHKIRTQQVCTYTRFFHGLREMLFLKELANKIGCIFGRLDLSRAYVAGHSFGGATAIAATAFSTDFQAAVVLDGWLSPLDPGHYERASQPSLFLNAANWNYIENVGRIQKLRNITEKLLYTFKDAEHYTFTDFPFLFNPLIGRTLKLHGETPVSLYK